MIKKGNKSGQVWIETVIYTLIALTMIGLVLSFAKPKILEIQDQAVIKQSLELLKKIDSTLLSMGCVGNQRFQEISIQKGDLKIDGENEKIIFEMKSQCVYSEPDINISDGSVTIITTKVADYYLVTLTLNYKDVYDIQFQGEDKMKTLTASSMSYSITILNNGEQIEGGSPVIDFSLR
jgi:hypothetical protein